MLDHPLNVTKPLTTIAVTLAAYTIPETRAEDDHGVALEEVISTQSPNPTNEKDSNHSVGTKEDLNISSVVLLNLLCFGLSFNYDELSQISILSSFLFMVVRAAMIILMARLRALPSPNSFDLDSPTNGDGTLGNATTIHVLGIVAMPILALLTVVLVIVQPDVKMSTWSMVGHAIAQAIWWFATLTLVRLQCVNTTANIDTISLSIQVALTGTSIGPIAKALVTALLSIGQSIVVIRPGAAARRNILVLVTVLVVGLWLRQDPRLATTPAFETSIIHGHPIETLIAESRVQFETLLAKQSKNLDEAVAQYQYRYGRRPPLGFDKWFNLAQENNFVLVDEFDTFMQSLEPFHGIHPSIIQQRLDSALKTDEGRMAIIKFNGGNVSMSENLGDVSEHLTNKTWLDIVPYNMTVALNAWDEPMVNAPWDEVAEAVHDAKSNKKFSYPVKMKQTNIMTLIETGKQNGWAATARACPIESPSRQLECAPQELGALISFISNATASKDVCEHCELLQQQGLLVSPGNMKVAHELVPIWSASKPSHFNDILYPSGYYVGVRGDYRAKMDIPWEEKDNKFYWVGRATGGWATSESWNHMQRQSLVLKTMETNKDPIQLLEEVVPGTNTWNPRFSTMAEIADLFATRISDVVQCTDEACEIEKEAFGLNKDIPTDPQDAAYSHKFVMDIDGNGFSGRFYRLLQSRSVVVKQTILQEWHDDRLIPWVHYVPVSTGYSELPELARFLASTEKGLELSERIARESTTWHEKALRDVDLRLVFLRMLLEYGRVMNPDMMY